MSRSRLNGKEHVAESPKQSQLAQGKRSGRLPQAHWAVARMGSENLMALASENELSLAVNCGQ